MGDLRFREGENDFRCSSHILAGRNHDPEPGDLRLDEGEIGHEQGEKSFGEGDHQILPVFAPRCDCC